MEHYIVIETWATENDEGTIIHGLSHTQAGAQKIFNEQLEYTKDEALKSGYCVYAESPDCFDAGEEGEYKYGHIKLFIEKITCVCDM